ncbi:hypothetical protein [Thermanaeromonas toyohensis]|nr:hypothetical protein [Thermanaeromonas toyohensis]
MRTRMSGGVRGRGLAVPSYSIITLSLLAFRLPFYFTAAQGRGRQG